MELGVKATSAVILESVEREERNSDLGKRRLRGACR
jgi:hypothetical protein